MELEEKIDLLTGKDQYAGYEATTELLAESRQSDAVYAYLDRFAEMMGSKNSYARTRALLLIAANARWDASGKIDALLDRYLAHILDEKPITARQCIQALPELAASKPQLKERIHRALETADLSQYKKDTMRPLVEKDIAAAAEQIKK
jgi:hypothetical protein